MHTHTHVHTYTCTQSLTFTHTALSQRLATTDKTEIGKTDSREVVISQG